MFYPHTQYKHVGHLPVLAGDIQVSPEYTQKLLVSLVSHSSLNTWSYHHIPSQPYQAIIWDHLGPSDIIWYQYQTSFNIMKNIINPPLIAVIDWCWPIDPYWYYMVDLLVEIVFPSWDDIKKSHLSEIVVRGSGLGRLGHVIHLHHRLLVKCCWWNLVKSGECSFDFFGGCVWMCLVFFSWKCGWKRIMKSQEATTKQLQEGCASSVSNPDLLEQ